MACIGTCSAAAIKTSMSCKNQQAASEHPVKKRADPLGNANPCLNVGLYDWPCEQMENSILTASKCADVGSGSSGAGTGPINT